ncbi:hypothetical protein RFI_16436 [Reticulomyxa filosa]|uniref:EF-hand domain-containing protein n=1 Tax=Reticulomyxa filosa TaxID=46433 RepID=X6N645_RETFI|nr:hypothetical protein RFI_16436 [Reticulomyxa filosa]|eukprot:ETO20782.1 hypothetical protein RFI_16436 [Reticulomyxa filosa]
MEIRALKKAFDASDFDQDGYLNMYEFDHLGKLLFGKNLMNYQQTCSFLNSNQIYGLTFEDICSIFGKESGDKTTQQMEMEKKAEEEEEEKEKKDKKQKKKEKKRKKKEKKGIKKKTTAKMRKKQTNQAKRTRAK